MSGMNFDQWPVAQMSDFEIVIIDATQWKSGEYTLMFNFYKTIAETEGDKSSGFTLCTHIGGTSLREVYLKIASLVADIGFFDGCDVSDHGVLWNEDGDEIATISWHQYSDDEWDSENGSDSDGLVIEVESEFPPPTMLQ